MGNTSSSVCLVEGKHGRMGTRRLPHRQLYTWPKCWTHRLIFLQTVEGAQILGYTEVLLNHSHWSHILTLNTHTLAEAMACHIMSPGVLHTVGDCITLFPLTSHTDLTHWPHTLTPTEATTYLLLPWRYCQLGTHLQKVPHIMNILDTHTHTNRSHHLQKGYITRGMS